MWGDCIKCEEKRKRECSTKQRGNLNKKTSGIELPLKLNPTIGSVGISRVFVIWQ
jgi:hypothetical protein